MRTAKWWQKAAVICEAKRMCDISIKWNYSHGRVRWHLDSRQFNTHIYVADVHLIDSTEDTHTNSQQWNEVRALS